MSTRIISTLLALVIAAHYAPAWADDQSAGQQGQYRVGETPPGLASLMGTKADENDLKRLGYDWVRGSDEGAGRQSY